MSGPAVEARIRPVGVIVLAVVTGGATTRPRLASASVLRLRCALARLSCSLSRCPRRLASGHARRALSSRHLVDERVSCCDCRRGLSIPHTRAQTSQPVREPRRVREREATELHQHEHLVSISAHAALVLLPRAGTTQPAAYRGWRTRVRATPKACSHDMLDASHVASTPRREHRFRASAPLRPRFIRNVKGGNQGRVPRHRHLALQRRSR